LTPNGKIDRKALPLPNAPLVLGDAAADQRPTPSISLHFQLLQLWEEVLNTRGVRLDDDFFAIGGNSLLAFRMISGLERLLGRRLPVATLFANPTIQGLSKAIMEGGVGSERPLLEVQPGSATSRPFFFLHGDYLGGGYYCVSLARRIGKEVPFYALVPRHIDPNGPLPTIEELAAEHIRHMRTVSPTGPYLLGGFCIGGVIAFEIARQLIAQGHNVGLLTLIDAETGYSGERWARRLTHACALVTGMPPTRQLAMFARLNQRIERLRQLGPVGLISQGLSRLGIFRRKASSTAANGMSSRLHTVTTASAAAHEQLTAYLWSVSGYHPAQLDIPAHLLASDEQAAVSRDPTVGWGSLLKRVEVRRLAGNHLESITRNLPKVAEILRPLIEIAAVTTNARTELAPSAKAASPELSRS
jgi:thioesterase domain-containing protein